MPLPNFHSARVQSPGRFKEGSIRTKEIAPGITLLVGRPKGKKTTEPQAYRFDAKKFTAAQAKAWLKEHKISVQSFEPAKAAALLSRTSALELERSRSYRKDTLRPGRFTAQGGGVIEITPERIQAMVGAFDAMRENGVKVPIYASTHKEAYKDVHNGDPEQIAANCIGYVGAAINDGEPLDLIYDFADDEAVKIAKRTQQVSACVEPEFTDGVGNTYKDAITHVLLTPEPVVPGQGEFKEMACFSRVDEAGDDNDVANLSTVGDSSETEQENEMELKQLAKELGLAEDADETACIAAITSLKARPEPPQQLARESVDGLVEATEAKLGVLVAKGLITPARADKLAPLLIGPEDKRNVYLLSRAQSGSDKSIAAAILDILGEEDKTVENGGTTGAQLPEGTAALSRDTDGITPEAAAKKADETKTDMAKIASAV